MARAPRTTTTAATATPTPATRQELVNLATAWVADTALVDFTSNIVIADAFVAAHKEAHPILTKPAAGNFAATDTPTTPKWFNTAAKKTTVGRALVYFVTEKQAKTGGSLVREIRQEPSKVSYFKRPVMPAA